MNFLAFYLSEICFELHQNMYHIPIVLKVCNLKIYLHLHTKSFLILLELKRAK